MEKWLEIALILLLALAVAGMIMLSGCTAINGNGEEQQAGGGAGAAEEDAWQYPAGNQSSTTRNGSSMPERSEVRNITDAQRQQMVQGQASACDGKAAGDTCTVQGDWGEMSGTCSERGGSMACMPSGMGGRGAPGNASGGFGQPGGMGSQPQGNITRPGFWQPPTSP
ncbi:MAG: hypothetical protein WC717_05365 [Candidatus Micrarchaeia archaeon]